MTTPVVSARGLRKAYKNKLALDNTAFDIPSGRIVGLIGPNGAGKTTALKAILGLIPFDGDLKVLGKDPRSQRDELMNEVCFIADVAVLPRWITRGPGHRVRRRRAPALRRAPSAALPRQGTQLKPSLRCARCPRA